MELAFTFPDPLNTTLFDSAAAPRGPSFTVHTHNCTTTIEKSVPTPVLAENEELGMDVEHVETLPVVRIHWRQGGSSMCVGDDDWASERRIHAIMPRERWYAKCVRPSQAAGQTSNSHAGWQFADVRQSARDVCVARLAATGA